MALSSIMTQSLLSANTLRRNANVQLNAKNRMDGHAEVLETEIKLDGARGGDTQKKQEELKEIKEKASALEEKTINTLAAASEDLKKAAKEDHEAEKAEKAAEKRKAEKAAEKKKAEKKASKERIEKAAGEKKAADTKTAESTETTELDRVAASEVAVAEHSPIDVVSEGIPVRGGTVAVSTGNHLDVKV